MDSNQSQGKTVEDRLNAYMTPDVPQPTAEEVKQPEPTPSSQQTPTEVQPPAPQLSADDEERQALENSKNPERTKSYIDKLKGELKAKEEALKARDTQPQETVMEFGNSVFDVVQPQVQQPVQQVAPQMPPVNLNQFPGLNPLQVENIVNQFVDRDGNVDLNGLNRTLSVASQQAQRATEDARMARQEIAEFEKNQQVRELHSKYPELDPMNKEKFDPKFFELMRDRLVRNMWESKKQDPVAVAAEIRNFYSPSPTVDRTQIEQHAVEQYKQTQQARIQGPIEQGKGEGRQPELTYDELRAKTRKGGLDNPALDTRLSNYFKSSK